MLKKILGVASTFFFVVACSEDKTSGVSVEDNACARTESSSSESFSSNSESSSSGHASVDVVVVNNDDLWSGPACDYKVNTGSENTGYWFFWEDVVSGGTSKIVFPVEKGNEYSESSLVPVVVYCEGLCGNIVFGNTSNPEAGLGFNVADEGESVDISPWGGLCVTYVSDIDFYIYLVSELGDKSDLSSMPQVRFAGLTKSDSSVTLNFIDSMTPITRCAKWSDFVISKDNLLEQSSDEYVKKAKTIIFKFYGLSGAKNSFNIKSVGTYDERLPGVK